MHHSRPGSSALLSSVAILALCFLVGLPTLYPRQYFLADDFGLVQHLHNLPFSRLLSYFASDWTEGIYGMRLDELRPLLALSYRFDAAVWGATNSAGYHLTNVLLHALCALLVLAIARSIAPANRWAGLVAGSLFAILSCHAEPLAWISGRVDSLASAFYLGAFLCFVRYRSRQTRTAYAGALILFSLGLFAKQSVVTLPLLLLAFDWILTRHFKWIHQAPFFAVLLFYLGLRRALFGSALREESLHPGVLIQFARRQVFYLGRLLPSAPDDPRLMKFAASLAAGIVLLVLARWLLAERSRYAHLFRPLLFFGPVWYALTTSPMIVTYASARHLYLTAAGFSIAAALLILPDPPSRLKSRLALFACLLLLYGAAAIRSLRPSMENGAASAATWSRLGAKLSAIPPGSTVFLALPALRHNLHFADFALPFALQPPFAKQDLYTMFTIVEENEDYCCPSPQWWARVQPLLSSLNGSRPVYLVSADALSQRTMPAAELKQQIEKALSRPLDSTIPGIGAADLDRLSKILFPATHND
jgi:hypothetical protein